MRVALVFKSGGEYKAEHVQTLAAQLREQRLEPIVLSDVEVKGVERVPLRYKWRGWWAKMNLFDPNIEGDLLAMDLDTEIVGELSDIVARREITLIDDFYRPGLRVSSGLMTLPAAARAETWERWHEQMISVFRGDGEFMNWLWYGRAATWPEVLPGQVVSYKCHVMKDPKKSKHVGDGTVPKNARVVCFHGNPRPWTISPLKVA